MALATSQLEKIPLLSIPQSDKSETRPSKLHFFGKIVQTLLFCSLSRPATLTYRTVRLLTYDSTKAVIYKVSGYHADAEAYLEGEYLKTLKAVRDTLFIPSLATRAFKDLIASPEDFVDDIDQKPIKDYLKVDYTISPQQFSSQLYGLRTFEVICPEGITEFPATTDPVLKTIMASHIFKPGFIGINFGTPNVSTFMTEEDADGSVQTTKTDAKSLWREKMTFHVTNGKIQTGVFLIPKNLPDEALKRFKDAAEALQGLKNITCVNTNCRVLQKAGFSIENIAIDKIVFPNELVEHLLFRNVFYTDLANVKHKVHFDILNTTSDNLESYFRDVDTAVVGTHFRHRRRKADTEENQKVRGEVARTLIAAEKERLARAEKTESFDDEYLGRRQITISVPSFLGDKVAKFWGRHTIYEMDLVDKQQEIFQAFHQFVNQSEKKETLKLRPFPKENPSFVTRLKRDIFFSEPVIRFLRRHMMGRVDTIHLHTQDIFRHLKSVESEHLNYVLLDDKMVLARVKPNKETSKGYKNAADWALTKHALLAERREVLCSGEMWYDKENKCFVMNENSGTYDPTFNRVKIVVDLANQIFDTARFGNVFVAKTFFQDTTL